MFYVWFEIFLFLSPLQAILYVSKIYPYQEFSDGSFEKPYTNLTIAINFSLLKNESQIILNEKDVYDDLFDDVYLQKPLEIKCSIETEFVSIKLNTGIIQIQNQVIFEGIIFSRSKINYNHHAFIIDENANFIFKV